MPIRIVDGAIGLEVDTTTSPWRAAGAVVPDTSGRSAAFEMPDVGAVEIRVLAPLRLPTAW